MQTWKLDPMKAEKRHAGETAKVGGARALAISNANSGARALANLKEVKTWLVQWTQTVKTGRDSRRLQFIDVIQSKTLQDALQIWESHAYLDGKVEAAWRKGCAIGKGWRREVSAMEVRNV